MKSLIWFQCSVTFLLLQLHQRFLNMKKLNTTRVRRRANLSLAEWSSVGEPHGSEEGYLPCLELQIAWKQCKYNSCFSTASQAQRQGSGVCRLFSYSRQWARPRLTSLELLCWVSTEAPGQSLFGKGMAGAEGNRSHPAWGPACSLPSPHRTELRSVCRETLGRM